MENKQTAVEWLIDQLERHKNGDNQWFSEVATKNRALRMEKEQIMNAYNHNMTGFDKLEQEEIGLNWSEDYYNETYGK